MRDLQSVVVDECNASAVDWVDRVSVDLLQMMLAGIVGRMRLAREDNLHVSARRGEEANQPIRISEDQFRPLVGREPAREANRQRARIEQWPRRDNGGRADILLRPPIACALPDEREEKALQRQTRVPERFVGNLEHTIPELAVILTVAPVGAEMVLEELRNLERQPRRGVDAVGDVGQRALSGLLALLKQRLPHLPRHISVELADAIREIGGAQRQRRHVELTVVFAECEKAAAMIGERSPRALQMMLEPVEVECVVTGGHGRVGRKNRRAAHGHERFVEGHTFGDVLVNPLKDDKAGMPFVQMPYGRGNAERAKRADPADAENDFLLQARFAITAVQTRREIAVLRRIFLEAGVE